MKILREEVSKGWWDRDIVDLLERTRTAATPHGGAEIVEILVSGR